MKADSPRLGETYKLGRQSWITCTDSDVGQHNSPRRAVTNCCRLALLYLTLGWAVLVSPCLGQEPEHPPAGENGANPAEVGGEAVGQTPALEPIPLLDITSQALEAHVRLEQIESEIKPSTIVARLALEFSEQAQTIAELRTELADLNPDNVTSRQLEDQRREWNQLSSQIDRWIQRADERWKELQVTREELNSNHRRWTLTRDAESTEELPEEVKRRVDQTLIRVESLQAEIGSQIEQVAEFIERLQDASERTREALRRLTTLTERVNRRLLRQDSPPLWQTQEVEWLRLDHSTRAAIGRWVVGLRSFVVDQWLRLLGQLLLFLVLAAAALAARKSSRNWPAEQTELDRGRFLLSRPYSLTLAFAILAGTLIYDTLPAVARDVFYLVLLVPMLRLAPGLTSVTERVALYGLFALSGLYQIVPFSPEGSLLLRISLLVAEIAAVVIVGQVIWLGRPRDGNAIALRRGAALAVCMAVLLSFVVALSANLFGWVNLSHFLTESTLLTCQGALLAILFVRASAGLLPAILRQGPGRALLSVRRHTRLYERVGVGLLAFLLLFLWTQQTLRRFRLSEAFAEQVESLLATPFFWADMDITVGNVLKAMLILAASILAQRVLSFQLREELFPRLHMRTSSTAIFATLLKYAIVAAGLGMAVSALGFTATQLTVLFGALGVGIGFGLQNIVNNFVSGLILMFERPIKIGDILDVGGAWGTVRQIGVRATVVQTFEGSEIVVPNGDLVSKEVKNWTLSDTAARVEVIVGTAYGSDPREVLEILLRVAKEQEFVFAEPEPFAMMFEFGDNSLHFRLFCYTSIEKRGPVTNEVHIGVYEALAEAGIEIPVPQRDLHIRAIESAVDFERLMQSD